MDQIFHFSLLSKFMQTNENNEKYILLFAVLYITYNLAKFSMPVHFVNDTQKRCKDFVTEFCLPLSQESELIIPVFKKQYTVYVYFKNKELVKNIYTLRFRALYYFLQKQRFTGISSIVEVVNFENDISTKDEEPEYMLFPTEKTKIQINFEGTPLWLTIMVEDEEPAKKNDDNQQLTTTRYSKNYVFRLSTQGQNKVHILERFVEKAMTDYFTENNRKGQIVLEYTKSMQCEEEGMRMVFNETKFSSNKDLEKNVFVENKQELIDYVDQFTVEKRGEYYEEYRKMGFVFKGSMLLYGTPGTGKSSIINAILKKTGRTGVFVRWSKIKTNEEFIRLFRNFTQNGKKYTLEDVCFIFEDFDANDSNVLKKRENVKESKDKEVQIQDLIDGLDDIKDFPIKTKITNSLSKLGSSLLPTPQEDSLTLDCVLNVLDGGIGLENAFYIFTTNHIEDLDPAFLRAGRFNFVCELKKATRSILKEMFKTKFDLNDIGPYEEGLEKIPDYYYSQAEIQKICFSYRKKNGQYLEKDIRACFLELTKIEEPLVVKKMKPGKSVFF